MSRARYALVLLADRLGRTAYDRVRELSGLFEHPNVIHTNVVIREAQVQEMEETINRMGAHTVTIPESGVVASTRAGVSELPLVDAFFLLDCASPHIPAIDHTLLERMMSAYLDGRSRLIRIVVCTGEGEYYWPALIDFGFRQPFVELPDDGDLPDVLQANASQVTTIEL